MHVTLTVFDTPHKIYRIGFCWRSDILDQLRKDGSLDREKVHSCRCNEFGHV